nr:hypothetical protein [Candidatus Sigynarchaeota archaeon]
MSRGTEEYLSLYLEDLKTRLVGQGFIEMNPSSPYLFQKHLGNGMMFADIHRIRTLEMKAEFSFVGLESLDERGRFFKELACLKRAGIDSFHAGLTISDAYCIRCHTDILDEIPWHRIAEVADQCSQKCYDFSRYQGEIKSLMNCCFKCVDEVHNITTHLILSKRLFMVVMKMMKTRKGKSNIMKETRGLVKEKEKMTLEL